MVTTDHYMLSFVVGVCLILFEFTQQQQQQQQQQGKYTQTRNGEIYVLLIQLSLPCRDWW